MSETEKPNYEELEASAAVLREALDTLLLQHPNKAYLEQTETNQGLTSRRYTHSKSLSDVYAAYKALATNAGTEMLAERRKLEASAAVMREALEEVRQSCDSDCPMNDGIGSIRPRECTCGAQKDNAIIAAALATNAGAEMLAERKHDKAEVDFLRQRLQEAELDRDGYCRERDAAIARAEKVEAALHKTLDLQFECDAQRARAEKLKAQVLSLGAMPCE